MQITDVLGRVVKEFPNGMFKLGTQSLTWDGTDNSGNKLIENIFLVVISKVVRLIIRISST